MDFRSILPIVGLLALAGCATAGVDQAPISSRAIAIIEQDGLRFRDLDRNGALTPYEDWRLTPAQRAADLLSRMTPAEKAGQMIVPQLLSDAPFGQPGTGHDSPALDAYVGTQLATHFNVRLASDPATLARANNGAQERAEAGRLGIPLTLSTNSRHGFTELVGASLGGGTFSSWPNSLGFAALGDAELVRSQADLVRRDLRATGFAVLLGPQIDLVSEPRWPRIYETYGADPELAARLTRAFVTGLQGSPDGLQRGGIAAVLKHFTGYGAAVDGFDAHNRYGRFSQLDAAEFRQHLRPFEGGIEAHAAGVMPAYSILRGLELDGEEVEPVGVGFNRRILSGVLRDQLGFEGFVLSDWGIVSDCGTICMEGFPQGQRPSFEGVSMAWGVEHLSVEQRVAKAVEAGIDQFGGLESTAPILAGLAQGLLSQEQVDRAVSHILAADFAVGHYDNPFVDPAAAAAARDREIAAGEEVQGRSLVLLESDASLPLAAGTRVLLHGVDEGEVRAAGLVPVTDPAEAQAAILRTGSPFETLHPNFVFGAMHHEGSLAFPADHPALAFMASLPEGLPLVAEVRLDRPAILAPFKHRASVLLAGFGASDRAFLRVVRGELAPEGRLPFELPSSMEAVLAQRPGLPGDSVDPLYPMGYRLDR